MSALSARASRLSTYKYFAKGKTPKRESVWFKIYFRRNVRQFFLGLFRLHCCHSFGCLTLRPKCFILAPLGRFAFGKTPRGPRCARQARQRLAKFWCHAAVFALLLELRQHLTLQELKNIINFRGVKRAKRQIAHSIGTAQWV